jgi:thiol-disulfide isomerase/thioredoxin
MRLKKTLGFITFSGFAALALATGSDSLLLPTFAASIHDAKSLKTDYIFQELGGNRNEYSLTLKKPNLVRIDAPNQLVVADGTDVTTFDKRAKTYYKQPETPALLAELFRADPYKTWAGFFDAGAYKVVSARDLGTTTKGTASYDAVETQIDRNGAKLVTYFLDPSDKIARVVEFESKHGSDKSTIVLRTRNLDVNGVSNDSLFTFKAPDDASQVSLEDVLAGKWYTSLEEAEKVASASGKKIFIDFMASWCGPCKMLQRQVLDTDDFKKFAAEKKLVLCRIDTDLNPDLMTRYGIDAIPVQAVVDARGNLLSQTVGYGDPSTFYSWLKGAVGG